MLAAHVNCDIMSSMKNRYEVRELDVLIHLRSSDGLWHECLADASDLPKLMGLNVTWRAEYARKSKAKLYAFTKHRDRTVSMHRFLMDNPENEVHHKDNNGLNNRRSTNLETLTHVQNMRERYAPHWSPEWQQLEALEALADDYRKERAIALQVQKDHGLTRQALWNIRNGVTSRSSAVGDYEARVKAANTLTLYQLKQAYPKSGKWGISKSGSPTHAAV